MSEKNWQRIIWIAAGDIYDGLSGAANDIDDAT
jgi:hypothetical protein